MGKESATGLYRAAPAKLNLGLHVLRKREDGFHDIETVFLRIGWSDVVSVQAAEDLSMTCSDAGLPSDDKNTCLRAARLLARRFDCASGARIHLDKRVPYGAGLGSGSSDAATTLRLLNELWDLSATDAELSALALEVGSDVPFFLNGPIAYAEGRGERLTPLDCSIAAARHAVVVVPNVHVASGEAYGLVSPEPEGRPHLPEIICSADMDQWRTDAINDFQQPIFVRHPEVARVHDALRRLGATYTSLSGSGSAVFGLFGSLENAMRASAAAELADLRVWTGPAGT